MEYYQKIISKTYPDVVLRVIPGHFVTANSHINYYIDMSLMKARQSEANAIGAYLANYLTEAGVISMNAHKTIYITSPEFAMNGQLIFRENMQPMIRDKHVLVLMASASTGKTVSSAIDVIHYYGGHLAGISSIFSAANKVYDFSINALFTTADIPDYHSYAPSSCSLCKEGKKVDAIVNGYGFSRV